MILFYIACGIASFTLFLSVVWRYSPDIKSGPMPSHFFILFMALAWSPLCFFPIDKTHIDYIDLSYEGQAAFNITYLMMYVFICVGFVFSSPFIRRKRSVLSVRLLTSIEMDRLSKFAIFLSAILILGYLASADLRQHLIDVWSYAQSTNLLTYTELRRELSSSSFLMASIRPRAQYSIVAFLFVSLTLLAIRKKKYIYIYAFLGFAIFVIGAVTFKKRPYLYFFAMMCATYIIYNKSSFEIRASFVWKVLAGILVSFSILVLLYSLQYKDNSAKDIGSHIQTLYFRVFSAYPAGYKLYLDIYPSEIPYTYGKAIGLLQPILGEVEQPYKSVPSFYGINKTTFPGGFVSYAYSGFGYIGVMFFSLMVGIILRFLNIFVASRSTMEFRVISMVVLGFATSYFTNRPFFSALFSAGLGWIPFMIVLVEKFVVRGGGRASKKRLNGYS